jgi:very-short-patch-repair endonuclease
MTKRHRRTDVIVHHTRTLPPEDCTTVSGIPVTTIARTLNDLGAVVPATTVEEALDSAERRSSRVRPAVVRRYHALRARGRNGIGAMTQILEQRDRPERTPRSVLERRMQRIFKEAGFPSAVSRFKLELHDGSVVELDFAIVELTLDVEVDGHAYHSTRRQRAADNDRASDIADAGWAIRRFTYEQVMYEPATVVAKLRSAINARRNGI